VLAAHGFAAEAGLRAAAAPALVQSSIFFGGIRGIHPPPAGIVDRNSSSMNAIAAWPFL
jgi:hypothetical protein